MENDLIVLACDGCGNGIRMTPISDDDQSPLEGDFYTDLNGDVLCRTCAITRNLPVD